MGCWLTPGVSGHSECPEGTGSAALGQSSGTRGISDLGKRKTALREARENLEQKRECKEESEREREQEGGRDRGEKER